jgi:hypothetical protein
MEPGGADSSSQSEKMIMKTTMKEVHPLSRAGVLSGLLMAAVGLTLVAGPTFAGSKGRKNTTIGLGAAAVYELLKGQTKTGIVLGVGTAVAWKQYEIARQREKREQAAQAAQTNSRVLGSSTTTSARRPIAARSSGSGSTATRGASSHAAAAAATAKVAAVKQAATIRQAAMQQNLDELAGQARTLSQQNQLQSSQLASLVALNTQSLETVARYFRWAMVAGVLAALAVGGLLYALLQPGLKRGGPKLAGMPA